MNTRRLVVLLALFAVIVMAISLTAAGQAQVSAVVRVDPATGPPGARVTVSGEGFTETDCQVTFYWDDPEGPTLGSANVDLGQFSTQVRIPSTAAAGDHVIIARGFNFSGEFCGPPSGDSAEVDFTVSQPSTFYDYNVYLQTRTLPDPGIDSDCVDAIQAAGGSTHAIVQLEMLPGMEDEVPVPQSADLPSQLAALGPAVYLPYIVGGKDASPVKPISLDDLEVMGITVLNYLNGMTGPGTAYLATVSSEIDPTDPDFLGMVRGLVCLLPEDRMQYGLLEQSGESDTTPIIVTFFSDVDPEEARTVMSELDLKSEPFAPPNSWQTEATDDQIMALADQDAVQWIEFGPLPLLFTLDNARALSNVDAVQNLDLGTGIYLGLSGAGVQIGINDSGVDQDHNDFAGRIIRFSDASGSDHGTHVAGIAAGSGVQSNQNDDAGDPNGGTAYQWRGMAPRAQIAAYSQDTVSMLLDAINNHGVDVTNHSYVLEVQGRYTANVASIDSIIRGLPAFLPFFPGVPARPAIWAAANQGNWGPRDCDGDMVPDVNRPQYPSGCPTAYQVSYFSNLAPCKNCLAVANLTDASNHNTGSSMGPTMDGRLKPEVSANGTGVISVGADIDSTGAITTGNGYRSKSGTSMAAPAVAGITALVLEQYADTYGVDLEVSPPLPSTSKAILIHTAIDQTGVDGAVSPDTGAAATYGAGPDWLTGFGLVDAQAAVQAVQDRLLIEDALSLSNVTDEWIVSVTPGQTEVRVTLAWDDLAGSPNANAAAPTLVNDLDLILIDPNGVIHRPLVLPIPTPNDCDGNAANGVQVGTCAGLDGVQNYFGPAAEGVDRRNNVEQVLVTDGAGLTPGNWTAQVSVLNADGVSVRLPFGGSQPYSLVGVTDSEANLSIEKSDSPDPVEAGEKLWYDITVHNDGPDTATDVVVLDTLPNDVTYDTDTDTCTLSAGTGPSGEDQLTCNLGDIPVGGTVSFTIQVTVNEDVVSGSGGPTTLTNLAEVFSTVPDSDTSDNSATAVTIVNDQADLRVTKECKPDRPVAAGDEAVCTIWVQNLGPSTARNVVAVDEHVSDGTFHFGDVTPDPECSETANPQVGAGTVTCNLGDIAAGETVVIKVPEWSDEWIDLNDHVTVSSDTFDPDPSNNQDEDHVEVRPVADLAISKTDFPDPVVAGSMLTYTLTITNMGPSEATDVRVEDVIPAGVTIMTVDTSPAGVCAPGTPGSAAHPTVCVFGNLANGDVATVTIVVMVHDDNDGPLHNSAQVFSDNADPNMIDNFASTTTIVGDSADLAVTKTDTPDPVNAGEELTYEVTITNNGPSEATDVALFDSLPPEVTFVDATISNGSGTCVLLIAPPNTVSCDLGTLSPGSFVTVFITVLVNPSTPDGTVISNTAMVSSATGDPVLGNNSATEETTVNAEADVEILKDGSVDVTNPAPLVTYDIDVINHGPSDALNVVFVDTLPLTPKKVVYTFDTGNGACAYDETAHTVTCDLGTVEAGESVEILIYVEIRGSVGVISNVVDATTTTFDPDLTNNTARKDLLIHG